MHRLRPRNHAPSSCVASVALPPCPVVQTSSVDVMDALAATTVSGAPGASSRFGGFARARARLWPPGSPQSRTIGPRPARVPACGRTSPHYLRRRLIRPSTTESNPATANRAAARFFCFDGVKSAISQGHLVPIEPNVARWNRLAQKERVRRVSARARLSFVWKRGGFCGGRPNGDFWRSAAGAEGS